MARQKKYKPAYLSFTRKERIGIIAIVLLLILYPISTHIYTVFNKPKTVDYSAFEKEITELNVKEPDSGKAFSKRDDDVAGYPPYQPSEKNYYSKFNKGELFYFDPNTLSAAGWIRLGVREKTANTIQKYIIKGGRFYKPADIEKIWGLHKEEVNRLLPYVQIEAKPEQGYHKKPDSEKGKNYEKPNYTITAVDINNADTAAFIALPGIGSKLAIRIIAFREKLGGFYKIEQVAETYALPDSTFQKIKNRLVFSSVHLNKLNINTATVDELKVHPYLRYNIANAIVQYRLQHGNFSLVSDIKKIGVVTDEIYNKAAPYLTLK